MNVSERVPSVINCDAVVVFSTLYLSLSRERAVTYESDCLCTIAIVLFGEVRF